MELTKPQKLIYNMEKFAGGSISVICGSMLIKGNKDLSEMKKAVNELYRLNDALRIRITETDKGVEQYISDYSEQDIKVLNFADKSELNAYAENYAKTPIDLYGDLCEINIIILPERYGLLVKLHHIVGDAWSLSLIGNQFITLLTGETPIAYSYADYVQSENNYLSSRRYDKDKDFFLEQFKKCDEVTYLNEKQSNTLNADRKTFVIDSDQAKQIIGYAQQKDTSAFILFTATLSSYINRTKMNAEKFYIGTAVLNRSSVKEKNTMGMFINTVPMLIELDNTKSIADNLSEIQKTSFSVFRHQKYNYGDTLSAIRKEYGFTEKLYDVVLSYQNAKITGTEEIFESEWYHCSQQEESLQIHMDDRDNEGIYKIHYDYQTEKYTEHEIEMLHTHIMNLLFEVIADDSKKIYELNILTEDEQQKLLYDFNNTAVDYPRDKCVHQLFEEQVEKTPDKTAVIACDKTLTYRELNEEANKIAHSLIEKGVGVGDIVAFALPRKNYLIATMLGILKSGAAYLPIDPDYPQDRIDYMLSDSNAKYFITEDNIAELLNNSNSLNPSVTMTSDSLCYCIYTSGSTGKPKLVTITNYNVLNFCQDSSKNHFLKRLINFCDSIISINNIIFDITVQETILPLLNNITVVFVQDIFNPKSIADNIHKKRIGLIITPTKLQVCMCDKTFCNNLTNVSVIMIGAEELHSGLIDWVRTYTNAKIINGYGPTETTCGVLYSEVVNSKDITIGKPIANTQIYIVDTYMKPTSIGATGEICIAGDCVGVGYLNRPELTAEKFIDNPFGEGKLYKTGDLAYWREDGNIVYVGRNDFQVKIRGLRIELGEIENAMLSVKGISQAVVVVRKNNEGRQLICAFYTGDEIDAKEIRNHIGKKLPKYMLPHIFTQLEEIPLTSSGKINRNALPEVDLYKIDNAVEFIAPQSKKEVALVNAIENTLGIDKVGIMDNFFDLGGDSLKAIELISKLQKSGYNTDTKIIFNCETVEELAEKLTASNTEEEAFEFEGDIPATAAQMRVYTAQNMNTDSTTYNVPYAFKVESLDVKKLQDAINKILARHDILKTQFENVDGNIVQIINKNAECKVEILNSGSITDFIRPFNLSKAPLIRVGVYENTVMIDMHHIITDGSSMPIFFHELNELYVGNELNDKAVQYNEFAINKFDDSKCEEYWLSAYSNEVPVLEINTDYPRGQKQSFNGDAIYNQIDIDLHNKIKSKCKELGITPYVYYMSGFNILLSKFSGNEDIVVGMPVSGRDAKYLNTIGMFVNTVALRNKPEGTKTVKDFLNEVKNNSLNAIVNQDYSFSELIKKLHIESVGRNPLFDVMFAYQSESMTDIVFNNKKAELLPVPITASKYDFTFNIMPRENDVVLMVEYCTDLYKKHTIKRFIEGYTQLLNQMLDTNKFIRELSVITENEQQKLLYEFNDTAVDYPRDRCVHQLFEEQAERTPDKIAIVACDQTLTYRELNEEANRIAHALIEKGIGRGDIVAIVLPRESHLISALFGVLKIGAAYMPLDPSYPQERIDYLIAESGTTFVINENNLFDCLSSTKINNTHVKVLPHDLFCALHTSGSTGQPKVTALTQKNLLNFLFSNKNFWKDVDTVVSVTIATFDVFMQETLLSASLGKKIILASNEQIYNQYEFEKMFEDEENIMFFSTPTKLMSYIKQSETANFLKKIRSLIVGGEVFTDELYDLIIEKLCIGTLRNGYGLAETTIGTTYTNPTPPEISTAESSLIFMDQRKLPFGFHKQIVIYNGYGPTETTLGTIFSAETIKIKR